LDLCSIFKDVIDSEKAPNLTTNLSAAVAPKICVVVNAPQKPTTKGLPENKISKPYTYQHYHAKGGETPPLQSSRTQTVFN
jgi:hypothetical protein